MVGNCKRKGNTSIFFVLHLTHNLTLFNRMVQIREGNKLSSVEAADGWSDIREMAAQSDMTGGENTPTSAPQQQEKKKQKNATQKKIWSP